MKLILAFLLVILPAAAMAERVALVIGNAAYRAVAPLANPGNDARAVADALDRQGFDVLLATDLSRSALRDTLRAFRQRADGAEFALVFYAGHGIEIAGRNYLIPVDARITDERDAPLEMIELDDVLAQVSGAARMKMVMLDACRDNPFVRRMKRENQGRNVGRGLAIVEEADADTLIAYAAAAGAVTPDGIAGNNSPFTTAFLAALSGPPTDVRLLLGAVRDEMRKSVPGAAPFVYSSLGGGQYVINPSSPGAKPTVTPAIPAPAPAREDAILRDFATAEIENTAAAWDTFLEAYRDMSDHTLHILAQRRRALLGGIEPPSQPPTVLAEPPADPDVASRALQTALRDRNCYSGAIDGILGRGSRGGLDEFARRAGADLSLDAEPTADALQAALAVIEASPDTRCPTREAAHPTASPRAANVQQQRSGQPQRPSRQEAPPPPVREDDTRHVPRQGSTLCVSASSYQRRFLNCD